MQNAELIEYALGIKTAHNFRIVNRIGDFLDELLFREDSPFNPELFPIVQQTNPNEQILTNPETGDTFRLSPTDILLDLFFKSPNLELVDNVTKSFQSLVVRELLKKYKGARFTRIGLLKKFRIKDKSELKILLALKEDFGNDAKIDHSITFHPKGISGINPDQDLISIVKISENDGDNIFLTLDTQIVFGVEHDDVSKIDFFLLRAAHQKVMQNIVTPWINKTK